MTRLRPLATAPVFLALAILAGCSTTGGRHASGGYYKDDGPGANPPADVASTPDAVPRIETYRTSTSKPYLVFGKRYVPVAPNQPFRQEGIASWYGRKFNGQKTASGEPYDMYAMTAAHPTLPIPSYARVTRVSTGKSVIVRINDRGPFHSKRIIDLSYAAAAKLGLIRDGSGKVIVQAITNDDIRKGDYEFAGKTAPDGHAPSSKPEPVPAPVQTAYAPQDEPTASSAEQIYLQFGAFSARQNAQHLASELNQQIGHIESRPAQIDPGAKLYRVRIGPYPSRAAAVNASLRIRQATGTASTIAVR